jgi:Mrp family chromosome partitioning ATPase
MRRPSDDVARIERSSAWIAGRARNALRRPGLAAAVGGTTFVVALLALVVAPRQATRAARVVPTPTERPDTAALIAHVGQAQSALIRAESLFATARNAAAPVEPPTAVDTLPPALVARRDTLTLAVSTLNRLLARAQNAPLPDSYRALGQARELRDDPRVQVLLDSLADIERERDSFDNLGGVDPVFVALTARATAVGRMIQDIAEGRRNALRRELLALQPAVTPPPPPPALADADTAAARTRLAEARRELGQALARLQVARARNSEIDARLQRARELANVVAPPVALLAAALVLGLVAGFGAALAAELRHPRLADPQESERVTGARVLAVIDQHTPVADRSRRRSEAQLPASLDYDASDSYRMLYLRFVPTGGTIPLLTITGDEPEVVATVATNLATAAAVEARSTLLVDGDLESAGATRAMRIGSEPGLAGVIDGTIEWAEAIVTVPIGRDGLLDVVPSGNWRKGALDAHVAEEVRRDLARLARRYDMTVLVAPAAHAALGARSFLPSPDVVVCARVGYTPLARLAGEVERLSGSGARVLGIVLWATDVPELPGRDELASTRRRFIRRRDAEGSEALY